MGIRYLNRFLKDNASPSIKLSRLSELSGKKIAVDISIYMYRFASDNTLIENMYLMLSVFRHYNIIPIFVFDGKPPPEKRELLQKRKEDKQDAENEYKKLENKYKNSVKPLKCVADFGTNIGEDLCCGQEGVLQDTKFICPDTMPTCSNFKCGSRFGTCM